MSDFPCPRNLAEVHLASLRLGCSRDKYGNNQYLCLPNIKKTALVELCHNGIMGMIVKGNCLETNEGKVFRKDCSEFKSGCPDTAFNSKDIYKYRACREINTEFNCYLAEPSCPRPTPNAELPIVNYNTTDILNHTKTNQRVESDGSVALLWVIAPIFIFVLGILLTIGYVHRRRICTNKKQYTERNREELKLLHEGEAANAEKPKNASESKGENQDKDFLKRFVGKYSDWRTTVSDAFLTMGCDQLYVLYCFLCSESDSPDFTKSDWLEILNEVRRIGFADLDPISSENAQETLEYLKRNESRLFEKDLKNITRDAADETIFRLAENSRFLTFYMSNYKTSHQYLRLSSYIKKRGEKCIINKSAHFDYLLIHRLMMDVLVHKSIEGTSMKKQISQILHIPENIITESFDKRKKCLRNLQQKREEIPNKHVKWLWKFHRNDIVRSCIGLYPHSDIYIINQKAYRKHGEYHKYSSNVRCLLYSLLFAKNSKLNLNDGEYKRIMLKIKDNFLPTHPFSDEEFKLPDAIVKSQSGEITFTSADIRHKVMYAFVTECLMEDVNMEFFLKEASKQVIFEYCRSWNYERKDRERCLYVPNEPVEMYDLFVERLDLDIIRHCTLSDWTIRNSVTEKLKVPLELLNWDRKARGRYVEYATKGTRIVHRSRVMFVGCAGAGKTTLLKRLLKCIDEEIYNVTTTQELEVHEEIFEILDEYLKVTENKTDRESRDFEGELNAKRLSVYDFGGQSVYYASKLNRRAFYIVVVDASKELHQRVSDTVCKQDDSVCAGWTFGDYFVFWMESIHACCATKNKEEEKPIVLIVATHWEEEKRKFKSKEDFLCCLQKQLPPGSNIAQYIEMENCYCINFPIQPITELEKRIASIARQERWKENFAKEWAFFGLEHK